jgi:hypothetical protein
MMARLRPTGPWPSSSSRVQKDVVLAIVAGLSIACLIYEVGRVGRILLGDFTTYWITARNVLAGAPVYPSWQLGGPYPLGNASFGGGYVYPPTAAIVSTPLGMFPLDVSWAVATSVLACALGAVAFKIARREGAGVRLSVAMTLALLFSGPALESLLTGNVNTLMALGLGIVWLAPQTSGYLAVVGSLIKIYPIIGLAWAVRTRAELLKPFIAGAAAVAASVILLGTQSWLDFLQVLTNGQPSGDFPLMSPRAALTTIAGPTVATLTGYLLAALLATVVIAGRRDRRDFFVLSVAMIVPAPDWYLHYFVVPLVGAFPSIVNMLVSRRNIVRPRNDVR